MSPQRRGLWRDASIQTKMLVIILPLVGVPMLILAAVGFVTSSREAAKASTRYLKQREADLRTLAENPAILNYANNRAYGLTEEAEVVRRELEGSFKRFVDRSNSIELVYPQVRYVDQHGDEIARVVEGRIRSDRGRVAEAPFFDAVKRLGPGEAYLSPVGPRMIYAMPVYQPAGEGRPPTFLGAVVLDLVYPIQDFQRTTAVIGRTFLIITALSLGIAFFLTINRVRRLTDPIRRLAEAANRIAAGQRSITVATDSRDEIGRLAHSFNEMAASLERNEAALQRKVHETRTLYEIGQEVTARVALEPTLRLIVERARELLQAEECLLALRQENSDTFAMQAYSGMVTEALAQIRFRAGEGVSGRVVMTARPVIVRDYLEEFRDSPFLGAVKEAGVRSHVAVPLKAQGTVIGVLLVQSRTPSKFDEQDQELLSALADQAAIAIENARLYEQVRRHAEELEAKVELRTRELQEVNRRLEAASRHKSEFLANMSHELRTPLNAIIGFTRLVLRRSKDVLPAKQSENLEKILISADHLLGLINDILDLSKIEAGRMEVRPVTFDLEPLVDACLRTVEPMLRSERLRLGKEIAPGLPPLFTDQDKLKQILINLLSNAIKFTEAGTVTVSARLEDGKMAIAVADTGIGIPEDARELIFEEFRQLDSSPTRKYGGTGLGLSISRHFARLLGGDITAESAVNVGSTFTVTIPVRYEGSPVTSRVPAPPAREARPGEGEPGKLVLAIDDDPDAVYLLRENLAEAGYRVVGALSGEEGLRKARELQPFAITLDIMMPQKDGWEILHELKADARTKDIPIIVVSIVDNKELGYRLGAFDYLLKPFDREAVVAALGRVPRAHGRLLVVDDDPRVVDMVQQLLEGEPYEVVAAADGVEALEAIARQQPDVILLDLLMPRMDGLAVIEHLQRDPRYRLIPVIVLTAKSLTAAEHATLEQSVLKVIRKMGLDRDSFIQELRSALQSYRDGTRRP
ncbi:MAG: response regulator [Candidatus Rokubacteria bacterium]|nr:response regulator [Candidatus Rokubacteria bacterium]